MTIALLALIVVSAISLWLRAKVRKAVVQPVGRDNILLDARLTEKPRWKYIKEEYGFHIGLVIGLISGIIIVNMF